MRCSPPTAGSWPCDLKVLQDDRNFFPKYNVALVLDQETAKKYPQIADLIAPVSKKLTNRCCCS